MFGFSTSAFQVSLMKTLIRCGSTLIDKTVFVSGRSVVAWMVQLFLEHRISSSWCRGLPFFLDVTMGDSSWMTENSYSWWRGASVEGPVCRFMLMIYSHWEATPNSSTSLYNGNHWLLYGLLWPRSKQCFQCWQQGSLEFTFSGQCCGRIKSFLPVVCGAFFSVCTESCCLNTCRSVCLRTVHVLGK